MVRIPLAGMALAGVAVVCWLVALHHPSGYSFFPKCQFFAITGWHCVGCGLTRSAHAWLNGDWQQGLAYHPLSFIVFPYLAWHFLILIWRLAWGDSPRAFRWRAPSWLVWSFVTLLMAFWVARNIPVYPLTLLAPHELQQAPPPESGE